MKRQTAMLERLRKAFNLSAVFAAVLVCWSAAVFATGPGSCDPCYVWDPDANGGEGGCVWDCDGNQECCGDECCNPDDCCGGQCGCGTGQECCGNECCDPADCCGGQCGCGTGQECCGNECCDPADCCGDECCSASEECCGGECCDPADCCGDECCSESEECCGGECCDPADCCGDECCDSSDSCCEDLKCYYPLLYHCCNDGNGTICLFDHTCCEGNCCWNYEETCCGGICCSKDDCCIDDICITDTCWTSQTDLASTVQCMDCEEISGDAKCSGTMQEYDDYDFCVYAGTGTNGYCGCHEEEQTVGYYYGCKINWDCGKIYQCALEAVECLIGPCTTGAGMCPLEVVACVACIKELSDSCTEPCVLVEKCEKDENNSSPIIRPVFTHFSGSSCAGNPLL